MKKLKTLILFVLSSVFAVMAQNTANVQHFSAGDFKKAIESKKYLIIDVRTPEEFAQGHIAGAININVASDDFGAQFKAKTAKQKSVAVYCRSGRRSKAAINEIMPLKLNIVELDNGIISWQQAGYPLTQGK